MTFLFTGSFSQSSTNLSTGKAITKNAGVREVYHAC